MLTCKFSPIVTHELFRSPLSNLQNFSGTHRAREWVPFFQAAELVRTAQPSVSQSMGTFTGERGFVGEGDKTNTHVCWAVTPQVLKRCPHGAVFDLTHLSLSHTPLGINDTKKECKGSAGEFTVPDTIFHFPKQTQSESDVSVFSPNCTVVWEYCLNDTESSEFVETCFKAQARAVFRNVSSPD